MAMRAASSPSHGKGNKKPNMARLGMVWTIFTNPKTGLAHLKCRVSHIPVGTPITIAQSMAAPVSQRCSIVRVRIWSPYCPRNPIISVAPDPDPACHGERHLHRLSQPEYQI